MSTRNNDGVMPSSVFVWIAVGTGLILLIPLITMQISDEVNWNAKDFIVAGLLLLSVGNLFAFVSRKSRPGRRVAIAIVFALALLYVYAELAVGIFTSLGS